MWWYYVGFVHSDSRQQSTEDRQVETSSTVGSTVKSGSQDERRVSLSLDQNLAIRIMSCNFVTIQLKVSKLQ